MEDGLTQIERRALDEFPSDLAGAAECRTILHDWFGRLREKASAEHTPYISFLWEAVEILEKLRSALVSDYERMPTRIWKWPAERDLMTAPPSWYEPDIERLEDSLASYLKRPWLQDNRIDGSAINAILFSTLALFTLDLRSGVAAGKLNWSFMLSGGRFGYQLLLSGVLPILSFIIRWLLLPATAFVLFDQGYKDSSTFVLILFGAYILYRIMALPLRVQSWGARRGAMRTADDKLKAMTAAWYASCGSIINPSRLKQFVIQAEQRGAIYPPVLHTLIDRACERDPTAMPTR